MTRAGGRKSIFITGAASGIGAETARHFSKRGWFCGLYDVNTAGLDAVEAEIGASNCMKAKLDVRNREDWAAATKDFGEATEGAMNVLFNNAGIGRHGWFEDITGEDNDAIIDINVKGVVNGVQAALPLLKATSGARVVNTASTAGVVGSPQLAVYSATKFAVRGLTEALDAESQDVGPIAREWHECVPGLDGRGTRLGRRSWKRYALYGGQGCRAGPFHGALVTGGDPQACARGRTLSRLGR